MDGVDIYAYHAPVRAELVAEQLDGSAWAAAQIDRVLAWPQIDPIEQGQGVLFGGLSTQPVGFRGVFAQRVHARSTRRGTFSAGLLGHAENVLPEASPSTTRYGGQRQRGEWRVLGVGRGMA